VTFRNLDGLVSDLSAWRGWQIKGAIPRFTAFDELLLIDGDIGFASNPEALFETPEYRATGTYFFRDDQSAWRFFSQVGSSKGCQSCQSRNFYNARRKWLQKLFGPTMPAAFPPEWAYHWREGYEVNATKEVMDSGVVALDRRRHPGLVQHVFRLNEDKAETYQHVWGDKETFWLAALLAGEPFAFHPREARHECLSLLAYATIGHSWMWKGKVRRWDNGEALRGTTFPGLMQRSVSGRMIYYHRKFIDVPMMKSWVLDANSALCAARISIDERNQNWFPHGFPLTHWVAAATLQWATIALRVGVLLVLGVTGLCACCLNRPSCILLNQTQRKHEREDSSDDGDDAPLLSRNSMSGERQEVRDQGTEPAMHLPSMDETRRGMAAL
jgi:hypothetical protein